MSPDEIIEEALRLLTDGSYPATEVRRIGQELIDVAVAEMEFDPPHQLAEELAESLINGNWTYVRGVLRGLPTKYAVATMHYLAQHLDEYAIGRLGRLLTDDL